MAETSNLKLITTPEATDKTFKTWRMEMAGTSNSNMTKIDSAFGSMVKVSKNQPTEDTNKVWFDTDAQQVTIPTMEDVDKQNLTLNALAYDSYSVTIDGYDSTRIENGKRRNPITGATISTSSAIGHCITKALNGTLFPMEALYIDLAGYSFRAYGFKDLFLDTSNYIGCSEIMKCATDYVFVRPNSWAYVVVEVFHDPDDNVELTPEELDSIAHAIKFLGIKSEIFKTETEKIIEQKTQIIPRAEEYRYSFGGIIDGVSTNARNRLRIITPSGSGGWKVGKGAKITVANGFKFGVARFRKYVRDSSAENEFIGIISIGSVAEYTATQDEVWRLYVGATTDEDLWKVDEEGVNVLTDTGLLAANALTITLAPREITKVVEELENNTGSNNFGTSSVFKLTHTIPYNAIKYHELYNAMVDNGWLTRSDAYYPVANDTAHKYPIHTYQLRANKNYLNPSYNVTSGELYTRPKILITSGFHGNERGTPSYLYEFIKSMKERPEFAKLAVGFDWTFIPLVNPWGYSNSLFNSKGELDKGSMKSDYTGYTFVENTENIHRGFRGNQDKIDINRNWHDGTGGFPTLEAQYVKNVLVNGDFDIVIDMHQAFNGGNTCGFVSISKKPSQMSEADYNEHCRKTYTKIAISGIDTDRRMNNHLNLDSIVQTAFAWDGTTDSTFRNYAGGYNPSGRVISFANFPDYSLCLETSPYCRPYHPIELIDNEEANTYGCTLVHIFYENLLTAYLNDN